MIEDKLTHDERLRLECVAQAVVRAGMRGNDTDAVLRDAARIEQFVRNGETR